MFFTKKNESIAVTFQTVQADIANGAQLLDVRTSDEFSSGHIDGAINLPLQSINASSMSSISKNQKVYVYCLSGGRSGQAASILKNAGYSDVTNLGGIGNVQKIGGTIVG